MALEIKFEDNDVIGDFKVLIHILHKQVGLASWGVLQNLLFFCNNMNKRKSRRKDLSSIGRRNNLKGRFFAFKLQGNTKWMDKTFGDLWASICWSPSLEVKYLNILTFAKIAKCQYVSTATCERNFFVQNNIK